MADRTNDREDGGPPKAKRRKTKRKPTKRRSAPKDGILPVKQTTPIPEDIQRFELEYHLPELVGSRQQLQRARTIRRAFLGDIVPHVMEITKEMSPKQAESIYRAMDRLRSESKAKTWIWIIGPNAGNAIGYLIALPAALDAEVERRRQQELRKEEQRRKAEDKKRRAEEVIAFAHRHGLPEIRSRVNSSRQEDFGRACRFDILSGLSEADLSAILPVICTVDDPGVWIGARDQEEPLQYVRQQAEQMASKGTESGMTGRCRTNGEMTIPDKGKMS